MWEEWLNVLRINSIAPITLAAALKNNLANSQYKIIAMMSSKMGSITDNTSGGAYIYRSSKAALNAAMKSLSIDLSDLGIKTLSFHPGWVQTDMGGSNAMITTETSISGIKQTLDNLTMEQSGSFINYDGSIIPW